MLGEITGRAKDSTLKGLLRYFEQAVLTGSGGVGAVGMGRRGQVWEMLGWRCITLMLCSAL